MNKRVTAVISSIFNSFCDFTLDIAVNKYSVYKVLLYTSIISFIFQALYAFYVDISITVQAIPIVLISGLIILLGYLCYVKALENIPIGLAALLENLDLFIILIIDILFGNLTLTPKFIFLFILFIISILWFSIETNRVKDEIKFKKIKFIGVVFILLSVLFYGIEPYIVKYANILGANEVAINFGYSAFAIPFFFFQSKKLDTAAKENNNKRFLILVVLIGFFEAIYYIFGTIGYIYETPIIVNIIQEIRVFLLVILSAVFKTDKMNLRKVIAILLGMISITGIYFIK